MPRNGSGTYVQPAGTAGVDGQIIYAAPYNNLTSDIGNEITNSLPVNGVKGMSAALNMNSNQITQVADPTAPQSAATKNYVDTALSGGGTSFVGGTTTGSSNAYVLATTNPGSFSLTAGNRLIFTPNFTNGGACTLQVTTPAIAATAIKKYSPTGPIDLVGGEIVASQQVEVISNGTVYQLVTNAGTQIPPSSISANTTFTTGSLGRLIEMTGSTNFTTTLPAAPATGGMFAFYNASSVAQTLSIPSGIFSGPAGSGSSTLSLLSGDTIEIRSDGTNWVVVLRYFNSAGIWAPGTLYGLTLSQASSTTVGIATGSTVNEDGSAGRNMTLGSAITKSLSGWASGSGNGGLDTGSIAANTWYHVHLIRKDTDGTIDALLSLSVAAPTMPSGYTARRRIGSIRTNGSSQVTAFTQVGDYFIWTASAQEYNSTITSATAQTVSLTNVPLNIRVFADLGAVGAAGAVGQGYVSSMLANDEAPDNTGAPPGFNFVTGGATARISFRGFIETNTSAQVRYRMTTATSTTVIIVTYGWTDTRGRT